MTRSSLGISKMYDPIPAYNREAVHVSYWREADVTANTSKTPAT